MFIAIDGKHGTGKTYIINKLYQRLKENGYSVVKTEEPTNTELGLFARKAENHYTAKTLVCLFAADRIQHCEQIRKWLREGKIVISDRYIVSGLILQNMDGVSFEYIKKVNSDILLPDLSIVVYSNSNLVMERLQEKELNRLTIQEQDEIYDRFLKYRHMLERLFDPIYFLSNNSLEDGEKIVRFIIKQIEQNLLHG